MLDLRLCHRFEGFDLDVSFTTERGVTALFGRSGSGKSTVVNAIAGLLRPESGRIDLDGEALFDFDAGRFVPPHRRRIGTVFQDARLFPHMTVQANLLYGQRFSKRATEGPTPERIVELLGLGALLHRLPTALSGGEKQRVALGRAILSHPRLLLMDEPLAALDEPRKAEILTYLERLRDEMALPILYVSHSVAEIARLASSVVVLENGRVMVAGPVEQVMANPAVAPSLGLREAGAIVSANVVVQEDDGLTRLLTEAGPIWLPRIEASPGATVRLRILAQDVMLATEPPQAISALNVLPMTVAAVMQGDGPGTLVQSQAGEMRLLSRVTNRSVQRLGLTVGARVYVVLKAVSVARGDIAGSQPQGD